MFFLQYIFFKSKLLLFSRFYKELNAGSFICLSVIQLGMIAGLPFINSSISFSCLKSVEVDLLFVFTKLHGSIILPRCLKFFLSLRRI